MTTGTHTVTAGTHAVVPAWRDWRSWVDRLVHAWRRSMRFRTLALTLGLTALTILVALVWMALAIQNDLYDSRTQQMLIEAQRATASAQQTLDAAEVEGDVVAIQNLMENVRLSIQRQSSACRNATHPAKRPATAMFRVFCGTYRSYR